MTSSLKNTIIQDTGYVKFPSGTTAQRPGYTAIQWTNTGSQTYSVIAGTTPTLTNTSWTAPAGVNFIELLVVAGGGGGGVGGAAPTYNGAGGAGGLIYSAAYAVTPGNSYTVTVGAGGGAGVNGSNSVFNDQTAVGGGYGGVNGGASTGNGGGSGGGGSFQLTNNEGAVSYNGGQGTPWQGSPGNSGPEGAYGGSGGGGAGGSPLPADGNSGSLGGPGVYYDISGTLIEYAKGGRGGNGAAGAVGTASTGMGGGANVAGGSGIVVIRYYLNAVSGMTRYNTSLGYTEMYNASTNLWNPVMDNRIMMNEANGGNSTIGYQGIYKTHYYTTVGASTFTPAYSGFVEVMAVAGGGGGGSYAAGGGGGGGGVLYNYAYWVNAGTTYQVGVGTGGWGGTSLSGLRSQIGGNSSFGSMIAFGGGAGGTGWNSGATDATAGGSGGGGQGYDGVSSQSTRAGGEGYPGQGSGGGSGKGIGTNSGAGGGGGGSAAIRATISNATTVAGNGGSAIAYSIIGHSFCLLYTSPSPRDS